MTALNEQQTERLEELAGRLRLIQADAASLPVEQRREYLNEEVTRSLKSVPSADRKPCLEALLDKFPVAGQILKATTAAVTPPPPPPSETFAQIRDRFCAEATKLSETERAELINQLAGLGLVRTNKEAIVVELTDKLRQALGLAGSRPPSLARLVEMAVFLVDALCLLDQNALKTMRELSPRSPLLKRPEDFRSAAARFLLGELDSLDPQWLAMRGLLGGLLAALQGAGKDFGRQYVSQLSPTAIEDVVAGEGGNAILGLGKSRKERCWEKYMALAKDFETADLVDRRIKDSFASFVEKRVPGGR